MSNERENGEHDANEGNAALEFVSRQYGDSRLLYEVEADRWAQEIAAEIREAQQAQREAWWLRRIPQWQLRGGPAWHDRHWKAVIIGCALAVGVLAAVAIGRL